MSQTCSELQIANKYWKTTRSSLTENTPNNHVIPSIGHTTAMFHIAALQTTKHNITVAEVKGQHRDKSTHHIVGQQTNT